MSLILNILLMYSILIVVNIPAPFLGLEFENDSDARLWYEPPGFVIPLMWFLLFALLGAARHILQAREAGRGGLILVLAFLCATYAYYTLGLAKLTGISALWYGLIGNLAVILVAAFIVIRLLPLSRDAALLVLPVILWTGYATLIVLGEMKQQKLI